jgi:hypothetical protein
MNVTTIDDVLTALDGIIQHAMDDNSRIGYFAALYRRVTRAVKNGTANNQFANGPLMEKLDVVFAKRYLDALDAYQNGEECSRCWRVAFDACKEDSRLILQHLLAGMNAHINLDLGVAAAEACPGDQLPSLKPNFDQINDVLASLVGAVEDEMCALSPLIANLSAIDLQSETTIINFNIDAARRMAWLTAERLANEPEILRDSTIDGLDLAVSVEGQAILYPLDKGDAIAAILAEEVQDVRRVIEILASDQPAKTPVAEQRMRCC